MIANPGRASGDARATAGARNWTGGYATRIWPVIAAMLWLVSLALPAIGARGGPAFDGHEVLLRGFEGWRYGVLAWFANPALAAALIAGVTGRGRAMALIATFGLVLGGSSLWAGQIAALAGRTVPELLLLEGFYFWMAAHAAAVVGGIIGVLRTHPLAPV